MATTRTEPKPCPFCGAAPQTRTKHHGTITLVSCESHGCNVSPAATGLDLGEAARRWNRRAPGARRELAEALRGLRLRGVITDEDVGRLEREGVE
jgi:hypothetical protein